MAFTEFILLFLHYVKLIHFWCNLYLTVFIFQMYSNNTSFQYNIILLRQKDLAHWGMKGFTYFLLLLSFVFLFVTPSSLSIMSSNNAWSLASMGAIEMSRTALNWPQLFKCSFSSRKKFQTNLLKCWDRILLYTVWSSALFTIIIIITSSSF